MARPPERMVDICPGLMVSTRSFKGTTEDYKRVFWQAMSQTANMLNDVDGRLIDQRAITTQMQERQEAETFKVGEALTAIANMLGAAANSDQWLKMYIEQTKETLETTAKGWNEEHKTIAQRVQTLEERRARSDQNWANVTTWKQDEVDKRFAALEEKVGEITAASLKARVEEETRDNKIREDIRTEMKIMQDDILRKWTGKAKTLEGDTHQKSVTTLQMEGLEQQMGGELARMTKSLEESLTRLGETTKARAVNRQTGHDGGAGKKTQRYSGETGKNRGRTKTEGTRYNRETGKNQRNSGKERAG